MSGHVPKFGGSNGGNFTEVFTLARGGGKAGSGDSAASSQPEESGNGPVYSGRGGGSGGGGRGGAAAAAAPPRRESGSTRSSQEGSSRPSPPGRREPREPREPREQSSRTGVRGSHDKGRHAARNDEYAGASHLPKFGEWNAGEGDTNYTVMFTAASKERKTGVAVDDAPMKGSGDPQSNSSRTPKKQSSCWPCF